MHLVGILFPHINDDARSKSHQILIKYICLLTHMIGLLPTVAVRILQKVWQEVAETSVNWTEARLSCLQYRCVFYLLIYLTWNGSRAIGKHWICKDVEGTCCGLILGIVLAFVWNDWGKPWKNHDYVCIGWDLNQTSECKSEELPHEPTYSVSVYCYCDICYQHAVE